MGAGTGWGVCFLWKNNSLRSDIFFRQKTHSPPSTDRAIGMG